MNKFDFIDYDTLTNDNCEITIYKGNVDTSTGKIILNGVEITDTESWNEAINTFIKLENEIDGKDKEITRLNNIIDELEKDLWKIRQLTFSKYNSNEWNNCLSFNDDILPIIKRIKALKEGKENDK